MIDRLSECIIGADINGAVPGMNEMILRECSDKDILSYAENIQPSLSTIS